MTNTALVTGAASDYLAGAYCPDVAGKGNGAIIIFQNIPAKEVALWAG